MRPGTRRRRRRAPGSAAPRGRPAIPRCDRRRAPGRADRDRPQRRRGPPRRSDPIRHRGSPAGPKREDGPRPPAEPGRARSRRRRPRPSPRPPDRFHARRRAGIRRPVARRGSPPPSESDRPSSGLPPDRVRQARSGAPIGYRAPAACLFLLCSITTPPAERVNNRHSGAEAQRGAPEPMMGRCIHRFGAPGRGFRARPAGAPE